MTTEPMPSASGPDPDTTAAELALGVLDGADRAAALRRILAEPDFARDVERWREHFALLLTDVAGEAAPGGLFDTITARIEGRDERPTTRNIWKPTAIAASIAALLMSVVALRPVDVPAPPAPQAVTAPMIAAMALTDTTESQPALYDADAGQVKMPGPMPIPAGRSAQLWVIEGDQAPRPLGLFKAVGAGSYVAEAKMGSVIAPGTKLAISIEPIGGSPTGAPTGPVIAAGLLTKV